MIKKTSIILSIAVISTSFPSGSEFAAADTKPNSVAKIVSTNSIDSAQKFLNRNSIQNSPNGTKYYLKLVPPPDIIDHIGIPAPSIKDPIGIGLEQMKKEVEIVPSVGQRNK